MATMRRMRGAITAATVLVLILLAAMSPARRGDGIARFRGEPLAHATASEAYENSRMLLDYPATRLVIRARRVTEVWRDPGHCHDPKPSQAQGEYRATVQTYTWFGLPFASIDAQCGGWYVSW
jgi:hypothetical protein